MAVQAYTDLFNNAVNDLATTLNAVTGLFSKGTTLTQ